MFNIHKLIYNRSFVRLFSKKYKDIDLQKYNDNNKLVDINNHKCKNRKLEVTLHNGIKSLYCSICKKKWNEKK
jgi:hypothetical protein